MFMHIFVPIDMWIFLWIIRLHKIIVLFILFFPKPCEIFGFCSKNVIFLVANNFLPQSYPHYPQFLTLCLSEQLLKKWLFSFFQPCVIMCAKGRVKWPQGSKKKLLAGFSALTWGHLTSEANEENGTFSESLPKGRVKWPQASWQSQGAQRNRQHQTDLGDTCERFCFTYGAGAG